MKHIILSFALLLASLTAIAQQTPDCQAPDNLSISNLTSTSVDIDWGLTAGHDAPTVYTFTLKDKNRTIISQDNALSAPNQSYSITGLTPNTTYIVELTGNCNASSSGYSTTSTVTFTTLCGARPVPYTQDFDTLTSLPACTYSSNATVSYVGRYGKGLTLRTTVSDGAYFVFPELSISSNIVECSLWLKASTVADGNIPVQVGLITDPSDIASSFEPLYFGELSDLNWKEIQMNTTNTHNPVTSASMIAVSISSGYNVDIYLDDVSIHQVPSCIRPEDFSVSNVLSTSAVLSWTTTNASNSRIYISSSDGNSTVLANSNPYTLTNLTPNTTYTVTLRGICSATDSSELCRQTLSFTTKCDIAASPLFHETFDTLSVPNTIPVCWESDWLSQVPENTAETPFTSSTSQVHTGTRAMMLQTQPTGTTSYLSTQLLPIDSAGKYTLSIWVYRQNASQYQMESLRFWASPTYNSTIGATLLGSIPLHYQSTPAEPTANLWYNYEYVIPTSGNRYIIIEGISETGASLYFDDVEVKLTPSCLKVSDIRLSSPTSSDVSLLWNAGNTESQWAVNYTLTQNASIVATVSDTVTSPTINISNLSPATVYSITGSVRALCSATDTSSSVPFSHTFTTACLPVTVIPYTCGFESAELSVQANPLPLCWKRLNNAISSLAYYPNATSSADLAHSGTGFLRFFPSNSLLYNYGNYQMAILPEIDASYPISSLRLTLYSRAQEATTSHNFIVGVISNPNDSNSFVAVDSFPVTGDTYVRHEILFDSYTGSGRYMAFKVRRSSIGQPVLCIDDVVIDTIPSCRDISGNGVVVSNITDVAARITTTDATATTWQYACGVAGTPVSTLTPVSVTSSFTQLSNLLPSTTYSVFVRRVCGSEYGNWSDPVSFTTTCSAAVPPFYESFETQSVGELGGCFTVETVNRAELLYVFDSPSGVSANQLFNHTSAGSRGLSSSDGAVQTALSSDATVATYMHFEAGKNYEISLYAKKYSNMYYDYGYHLTFNLGTTMSNLYSVGYHTVSGENFERYASSFTVPYTGNYYIGFTTSTVVGSVSYYPYIDDIRIEEVACSAPSSVFVSDLSSSTAELNITSTASTWHVAVSSFPIDIEGTIDGDIMYDTVTSTVVNVTGLLTNSDYYYTVRSICPNGECSAWTTPGSFHTRCANETIPYFEDFERVGSTSCWTPTGNGSVSRATDQSYSGNASMLLSNIMAVSPQMNVVSLAPYMFTAWAYTTGTGASIALSVMTDPDDASTLETIALFTLSSANRWTEISALFDILNDPGYEEFYNARYVVLTVSGDAPVYFDDINILTPPSCAKPTNGSVTNITATSASVNWTESGTATSWRIRAVPANGTPTIVDVTTHPYTISNLNPSTLYSFYVSAICSATDTSPELNIGKYLTSCGVVTAPYTEDFELQATKTTPACWNLTGTNTSYISVERIWGVHEISGNRSIRMWNWGVQNGDAVINSPEIYIPAGGSFELAYDYAHQATSGPLMVKIRRHSETTYTTIDSNPNTGHSTTEGSLPIKFYTSIVPLTAYAGDTVTIQFFNVADDIYGDGALFVDNVRVRVANPCAVPSVSIASLTDVSAKFLISDTAHTSWQYVCGPQGFDVSAAQPQTTTSTTISLTNLSSFTFYTLYVRSVCGSGSYSDWQPLTFQTASYVTPLPYSTDFSNPADNNLWIKEGDDENSFIFGNAASALINSSYALYVSSDGLHYNYDIAVNSMACISRLFNFNDSVYDIEFDWQCPGGKYVLNGVADYGRFYLMPAYADPLPQGEGMYYRYYFWDNGIIPLDGDTCLELISGKQHTSALVDMTGRSGAYRLVFFWFTENGGSTAPTPLSVANLYIGALTCNPVSNLVVPAETITRTSAYVHCNNSAASLRWVISSSPLVADSLLSGTSSTDTFTVNGLLPSTRYYLFVRSQCSASDASPWSSVVFNTLCGPITDYPHVEDFEDATFPPYCWSASGWSRYTNRPYSYAHGNGCAQAGFNSDQNLISPELMLDADRQYFLSFWLLRSNLSYYTDQLKVYISPSTSLNDATLLQSYITFDPSVSSDGLVFYKIDLPEGLSGIHYIIFSATGAGSYQTIYLDDITFGIYPLCRQLLNAPVATARTATTVTLSSDANNYTSTQYGVAPYSVNATPADITTIVDSSYVTGLTANTSYSIFARGICSFCSDTTDWSPAVKVTTRSTDCFAPDGLSFVSQTSDTVASIRWNVVPDVSLYQIVLSSVNGSDTITTTSTSAVFSPLTANTAYTFAIRGFCSGSDTTDWSTLNFTTLRTPATIPYHTGFEPTDDNALWNTVTSAYSNFTIGTDGGGRHSGNQGLYVSADGNTYSQTYPTAPGHNNVYGSAYITRTIYFHEAGNYEVSFDWKSDPISENTYGYFDAYGRAFLTTANTSLPVDVSTYATAYPEDAVSIASQLTGSQTWQRISAIVSVPEAGYRDIVFQWYSFSKYNSADDGDLSDYPLAIDNLAIERVFCLSVNSLSVLTYSDTCATVKADRSVSVPLEYALLTVNNEDSIGSVASIDADTIRLSGLNPQTTYYLFVRQVCDSVYSSSWRSVSFRTTTAPAVLPYICDFEDTDENNRWVFTQNQQNQFVIGTNAYGDGTRALYVSSDGSSNTYNNTMASYAYATRTFYLTPGDYYCSFDWRNLGETNYDYARLFFYSADHSMPLGSYLPDLGYNWLPYSAVALDGGSQLVGNSSIVNRETNFNIPTEGSYNLVVAWVNDGVGGSNPPFVLDNVKVHSTSCFAPSVSVVNDLQVAGLSSAVLSSPHTGMDVVYAVSKTADFNDAVLTDTLRDFSGSDTILLSGISPSTNYYFLCRSLCSADDYSVLASTSFRTPCGTITDFPYHESFESVSTTYISGMISSICWTPFGASSGSTGNPRYLANTTAANVTDGSRSLQLVGHRTNALTLALPEMADISDLRLTFDVRYDADRNMPILTAGYLTDASDASSFVAVKTTTVSSSTKSYVVTFTGAPVGSTIAFRFVGGNTNGKSAFLDNVTVLHIIDGDSYTDTVCYSDGYNLHGFSLSADSIPVGVSTHYRTVQAAVSSAPDTLHTLTLLKRPEAILTFYDTICGGNPYVQGIWNIPNPITRRYHQVFQGASQFGCDSTVELFLEVIPSSSIIRDTICKGSSYQFGSQTITKAGSYTRTYQTTHGCTATDTLYLEVVTDSVFSSVSICQANLPYRWHNQNYYFTGIYNETVTGAHGCPQVDVLNLTVFSADTTINASLCSGGSVRVLDTIVSATGTYTLHRISIHGCDVTYHINVTETPIVPEDVYDIACEGKPYSGFGITSLTVTADTVITINTRSLDNLCDSIAYIHLIFSPTQHGDTSATMPQGGSFTWHDQTYTTPGDYQITLQDVNGCDSIVTLHLTIGQGIEDAHISTITLYPNPAHSGEPVTISLDQSLAANLAAIQILTSTGDIIYTDAVTSTDHSALTLDLGHLPSGIYFVMLTSSDGTTYLQKLIIQ